MSAELVLMLSHYQRVGCLCLSCCCSPHPYTVSWKLPDITAEHGHCGIAVIEKTGWSQSLVVNAMT